MGSRIRVAFPIALLALGVLLFSQITPKVTPEGDSLGLSVNGECGKPRPITLPPLLARTTSFEASGLLWIDELRGYLIASDDTGTDRSKGMPWVFFMDPKGTVRPVIVPISEVSEVQDLEAIARDDEGFIYLLSSQSSDKKGVISPERNQFIKAELKGFNLRTVSVVQLRPLLEELAQGSPDFLRRLGVVDEQWSELNIEGLAFRRGALYLGLVAPLDDRGRALIWRIRNPHRLFERHRLAADDIELWARVALVVGSKNQPDGISDMLFLPDGRLVLLSGKRRQGHIWVVVHPSKEGGTAELQARCVGLNPEGVSLDPEAGNNAISVVFDRGGKQPAWTRLELPTP